MGVNGGLKVGFEDRVKATLKPQWRQWNTTTTFGRE